ncbi:MAG: hypothetical protein II207_05760 [Clostridia bacterium]|nr:hypothetical protein [Clostridia bacterium]
MIRFGVEFHPEWLLVLPLLTILEEGDEGTTITIGWLIFSLCINIKR